MSKKSDKKATKVKAKRATPRSSVSAAKQKAERLSYELMAAAYQGAFPTRTSNLWGQSESMGAVPALNLTAARNMRDRARQLVMDNPLASSILDRAAENIIGNGFQVQALSSDTEWNAKAEAFFNNWTKTADFYGRSWVQHQYIHCYGYLRDGDIGTSLMSKGQLQLIEGDYISTPYGQDNAYYHDGIELNANGQISKYWIMSYIDQHKQEWYSSPAKNFLFCRHERRNIQYRGETFFAQTFDQFDQLGGYLKAVVLAQKIAACYGVVITRVDPVASVKGLGNTKNNQGVTQRAMNIEPGMIQTLNVGEQIQQISPQQPGSNFDANTRMLLRLLGVPFGLPLEYVLMDFSTVSGQTAKASAQAAQRAFEKTQRYLVDEYYTRVYEWRIAKAIKDGDLEDRPDALIHKWHAEPWPYLDRVAELKATQLEIDIGINTERRANMAIGNNPDQIRDERKAELDYKRAKNMPIYHSLNVQEIGVKAPVSVEESDGAPENNSVGNNAA